MDFKQVPFTVNIWPHQRRALEFLVHHLNTVSTPCLVRMPTGTGKTGVIACLSLMSAPSRTLVLTPWTNLRAQMIDALRKDFWSSVGFPAPHRQIEELLPSNAKKLLAQASTDVLVTTFVSLNDIRRDQPDVYLTLSKFVDLVVIDEGHYEPALEWKKSVQGLKSRAVLLTATPYRNDLKLFRIEDPDKSVHHFRHVDAEDVGVIRRLRFEKLPGSTDVKTLADTFVDFWEDANTSGLLASNEPRAIICCADALGIRETVQQLRKRGVKAIGIHDQFKRDVKRHLYKNVPPTSTDANVWVHQYKLMEGLDDHRFCCIALFGLIQNDRRLIQQIGRILRTHKTDRPGASAVLVAPNEFDVAQRWTAYREFEKDATLLTTQHFRKVVKNLLDSQPSAEYFEGRFRTRFVPNEVTIDPRVTVAPSVLVRQVTKDFSLSDYVEDCTDTLNLADAIILGPDANAPCQQSSDHALWVYASVRNSRLLQSESLYEIRLEAHCAVLAKGHLLISDTSGNFPIEYLDEVTVGIGAGDLSRLLDSKFRLTNISTTSAIPFDTVLRGADARGHDIASIPSSLTDRIQICRSARGSSSADGRRYVGLSRGRVRQELSEGERRTYAVGEFVGWARQVAHTLSSRKPAHSVFQRYMQTCTPPHTPRPATISIDLLRFNLVLTTLAGAAVQIESSSSDITVATGSGSASYICSFHFATQARPSKALTIQLKLEYQAHRLRFWFKSGDGEAIRVETSDTPQSSPKSLSEYLNQNQDLVLIGLAGGEIVYQGRNFYRVDYSRGEQVLVERIVPLAIPACSTEKGTKAQLAVAKATATKATAFLDKSLFKAIAERAETIPFIADTLICEDLGSECADFIATNFSHKQMALIHAKTAGNSGISASSFHDVVAQAMKNLAYLTRNAEQPDGAASWRSDRYWNKTKIPRAVRLPPGSPVGAALWKMIRSDIIDSANAELHVVLVTAGCCNLAMLQRAVKDPAHRTPETAQLMHLLEGLSGHARQLGARLTIYDVPFVAS